MGARKSWINSWWARFGMPAVIISVGMPISAAIRQKEDLTGYFIYGAIFVTVGVACLLVAAFRAARQRHTPTAESSTRSPVSRRF